MPDIIVQRIIGGTLFNISLRDHASWIYFRREAESEQIPFPVSGYVWDLGSNIGIHSVAAAKSGCRVTAFDISATNVLCLRRTAAQNFLNIKVILSPITAERDCFTPAESGHTEEKLRFGGDLETLCFSDAADKFGVPDFIKIDIEGAEDELLASAAFRDFVLHERITVYMELHRGNENLLWPEFKRVDGTHWLLKPHTGDE